MPKPRTCHVTPPCPAGKQSIFRINKDTRFEQPCCRKPNAYIEFLKARARSGGRGRSVSPKRYSKASSPRSRPKSPKSPKRSPRRRSPARAMQAAAPKMYASAGGVGATTGLSPRRRAAPAPAPRAAPKMYSAGGVGATSGLSPRSQATAPQRRRSPRNLERKPIYRTSSTRSAPSLSATSCAPNTTGLGQNGQMYYTKPTRGGWNKWEKCSNKNAPNCNALDKCDYL